MKVTLNSRDYEAITGIVREKLRELSKNLPDNEFLNVDILFGPEFMAKPLRIDTPSTQFEFREDQLNFIKNLRTSIHNSTEDEAEKKRKIQNLESIILFGQILFAQSASLHFLNESKGYEGIDDKLEKLQGIIEKEGIIHTSSKSETLTRRKEFNDLLGDVRHTIKQSALPPSEKSRLLNNLDKSQSFYYQANDFNFKYANKPYRKFDHFMSHYESFSSKVALACSFIAIGATALSLIPPLAPIMAPIALAAAITSIAVTMPVALKNIGTMIYNLVKYGAKPTPAEITSAAIFGTNLATLGTGNIVGNAVNAGLIAKDALRITQGVSSAINTIKIGLGLKGQIEGLDSKAKVSLYKTELEHFKQDKPQEETKQTQEETEQTQEEPEQTQLKSF